MFDFRYHALSLTAVVVALVLGVLLGVAIGDRGLVSSGEKSIRSDLRHAIASSQHRADELQGKLNGRKKVLDKVFPLLVDGRLARQDVGIVYLGPKSDAANGAILDAVKTAGGHPAWQLAFKEPLDAEAIAANAGSTQYTHLADDPTPDDPTLYSDLGERVGTQLVTGGQAAQARARVAVGLVRRRADAGRQHRRRAQPAGRPRPAAEGDGRRVRDRRDQAACAQARRDRDRRPDRHRDAVADQLVRPARA